MKMLNDNNSNISRLNNSNDLDAEIAKIELRLLQNKTELETHFKQIPHQAVRTILGSRFPLLLKPKNSNTSIHILQTLMSGVVASAINAKRGKTTFKQGLSQTAKQAGFWGMLSLTVFLLQKKRKKSPIKNYL